jgi:chaperonin cofactor prefoldin
VKVQVTAAELQSVREDVERLDVRITAIEERERAAAENAAEFRGEMRAAIGRVFDKLNIQRGSAP